MMSLPTDIPSDIWDAAEAVTGFVSNEFAAAIMGNGPAVESEESLIRPAIARAIMAERKRCEAVCVARSERHKAAVANYPDDEKSRAVCLEGAIEALECATAIRKGAQ